MRMINGIFKPEPIFVLYIMIYAVFDINFSAINLHEILIQLIINIKIFNRLLFIV